MTTSPVYVLLVLGASALAAASQGDIYTLDNTWKPTFPSGAHTFSAVGIAYMRNSFPGDPPVGSLVYVTQRGNASLPPVLVINATDGALVSSWGKESVGLDYKNPAAPTWGAHGLAIEECNYPCQADEGFYAWMRVYVDDFTNHTLTAYTGAGKKLLQIGTNGVAGNGTSPIQFGNIADSVIETGIVAPSPSAPSMSHIYSSDGDGGSANRVIKVGIGMSAETSKFEWATQAIYNNPHSIALHRKSNLLVVANREGNETRLLRAKDGADLGAWSCGLDYGSSGKPFGVRTLSHYNAKCKRYEDLMFVAIMDNPQDGKNQKIAILDVSGLNEADGPKSKCTVLQQLTIPSEYSGPHLLGVDSHNGDIYAALVADAPQSAVLRFTSTCGSADSTIQV